MKKLHILLFFSLMLSLSSCEEPEGETIGEEISERPEEADTFLNKFNEVKPQVILVDTARPKAVAGDSGWNFQQTATADLNGDGVKETVYVIAQVEKYRNNFAWDDGQAWQVYIQDGDSQRTYVFSKYVQLGKVTPYITEQENGKLALVLLEQTGSGIGVYEITYKSPKDVKTNVILDRMLYGQGWFEGASVM